MRWAAGPPEASLVQTQHYRSNKIVVFLATDSPNCVQHLPGMGGGLILLSADWLVEAEGIL
jgi:hypothetical protein